MGKAVRVLITGGRGFAGRHTIDHLLETTDWEIVALDSPRGNSANRERVTRLYHDLRAPISWQLDEAIGEVDCVLHLAASADVHAFLKEGPVNHVLNNINSILTMLEWARERRNLTHFVLASTNEVYGPSMFTGGEMEWSAIAPPTPYSGSKAAQEALAIAWWRTYGVPLVITNTMQLFGLDQPAERFIPSVVQRIAANEPVDVYGKRNSEGDWISASRCWTHVRNYADALRWLLGEPPQRWPRFTKPSRWNIAGPEVSCRELIIAIGHYMGKQPTLNWIESNDARPGHELRYALDTSKITDAGWTPPYVFDAVLRGTVQAIASRLGFNG